VSWGSWTLVGGVLAGPPAVARAVDGRDMVFARQADGGVYYARQRWDAPLATGASNGTKFSEWVPLAGAFAAGPAVVAKSSGLLEVLAQGVDRQMYHAAQADVDGKVAFGPFQPMGGRTKQFAC